MSIYEKVFKASFVDLNTGEMKQFQYNPENWSDERFINYASIVIPGLNFPRYQFISGGDTVIQLRLFLTALNHSRGGQGILDDFQWFRSRTYPKREGNALKVAPTKILFIWPGLYSSKCIMTSCNAEWDAFFPDGKPKYGYVNIELKKTY